MKKHKKICGCIYEVNKDNTVQHVQCAQLISADIHNALKEIEEYARSQHGICITALRGYGFLSGAEKFRAID